MDNDDSLFPSDGESKLGGDEKRASEDGIQADVEADATANLAPTISSEYAKKVKKTTQWADGGDRPLEIVVDSGNSELERVDNDEVQHPKPQNCELISY